MIKGCILPWIHIHGNIAGKYKACCFSDGAIDDINFNLASSEDNILEEVWNGPGLRDLRLQFLENKKPAQCVKHCYNKEDAKIKSPRMVYNERFAKEEHRQSITRQDGFLPELPTYIDIRFGNICNFRCRTCGPMLSTRWDRDSKVLNREPIGVVDKWTNNDKLWEALPELAPSITDLYFAGGEPLMQEGHYKLLDWLIENNYTDISITYNTNLSVLTYKDYDLRKLWKNFREVKLWPSCDGFGKQGEYTRTEFNWGRFAAHVAEMQKHITTISSVVSIYSIYSLPKLLVWAKKYGIEVHGTCLVSPEQQNIQILSKREKSKINQYYKDFLSTRHAIFSKSQINNILDWLLYMNNGKTNLKLQKDFKIYNEKLATVRSDLPFVEVYPEYKEWYESL